MRIEVEVEEGVASLGGIVNNILAKERAVEAARGVRGVRSVIDRIEVRPTARTAEEIRTDVKDALLMDPATDSYQLEVSVDDGEVALSGEVASWQEKQLALHVAKGVRGVSAVTDNMTVDYEVKRPASEIKTEIERAQQIDVMVHAPAIKVDVVDDEVTLSGFAGSATEKNRAIANSWVAGVESVNADELTVEPWAEDGMAQKPDDVFKTDADIKRAVGDAFRYDPRLSDANPTVEVASGVVTLSGVVESVKAKRAADRDARNTLGVVRVENELRVRPENPVPDDELSASVKGALLRNGITESFQIKLAVEGGVVTLSGVVDSYLEKSEAEEVTQNTKGVMAVVNKLEVSYPSLTYSDYDHDPLLDVDPYYLGDLSGVSVRGDVGIREDIYSEFFWSPFVSGENIMVTVEDGVATLTGEVEDATELRFAVQNAREGGAREVVNRLTIAE